MTPPLPGRERSRRINWPLLREVAVLMAPFLLMGAVLALVALLLSPIAVVVVAAVLTVTALVWAFTVPKDKV